MSFTPHGGKPLTLELPQTDPYREQIGYFLTCCQSGAEPAACPLEQSAQAIRLALRVREIALS